MNWIDEMLDEDYLGIWEVLWRLNAIRPESIGAKNLSAAKHAVLPKLKDGIYVVYQEHDGDFSPLSLDEALMVAGGDQAWNPGAEGFREYWLGFPQPTNDNKRNGGN